jgi:hypothetical protein
MTVRNLISAFRDLAETIRLGLCKLNEIQFSAPWAPRRNRCSGL